MNIHRNIQKTSLRSTLIANFLPNILLRLWVGLNCADQLHSFEATNSEGSKNICWVVPSYATVIENIHQTLCFVSANVCVYDW